MKKNSIWNKTVRFVNILLGLGLGAGIAIMSPVMRNIRHITFGQYLIGLGLLLIKIYLAFFLQLIIHEGGHLIFGLLTGYGFSSFRIMNFMLIRKGNRIELKKHSLSGTSGQCLMSPPEMKDGRLPYVLYNLGGVLMNLIVSVLCAGLYFLLRSGEKYPEFLSIMALSGVYIALTNGIPLNATVPNDGHNAFYLGKDPVAMRSFWVQLAVNAESAQEKRIKDMPEEWFIIPEEADMSNNLIASWLTLTENRAMDLHDFGKAKQILDRLLGGECELVELYRVLMLNDRAYIDILEKGKDADLSYLEEKDAAAVLKQMRNYPSVMRTDYASALIAKQDRNEAEKILDRFRKVALTYPSGADIAAEAELMEIADNTAGPEETVQLTD